MYTPHVLSPWLGFLLFPREPSKILRLVTKHITLNSCQGSIAQTTEQKPSYKQITEKLFYKTLVFVFHFILVYLFKLFIDTQPSFFSFFLEYAGELRSI